MHSFEDINEKYGLIIKKIYEKYFYVNLDYELYKSIVVRVSTKTEKSDDSRYFLECLNDAMKKYVKTMFKDTTHAFSILSNYIDSVVNNVSSYKDAIKELEKISSFLSFVYDDYTFSYFQEFLNNPKLFKMVQIVVNENLNIIKKGKLDTIFDNEILITLLQVYCINNNIDFISLDDEEPGIDVDLSDTYVNDNGYIRGLQNPLPNDEILELLRKSSMGDKKARDKVMAHNSKLVAKIAKRYCSRCRSLSFMDLFQEGNIGLMKAIDMFDESKGCTFSTYAVVWIQQNITRAIYDTDKSIRLPEHKDRLLKKYLYASRELEYALGRKATVSEIADELNIPIDKVIELANITSVITSLNVTVGEDNDTELGDLYIDDKEDFVDEIISSNMIEEFKKALDRVTSLTKKEKNILCLRIGIDEDKKTLEEIGAIYKLTRERIRQIEAKALKKFRRSKEAKAFLIYSRNPREALEFLKASTAKSDIKREETSLRETPKEDVSLKEKPKEELSLEEKPKEEPVVRKNSNNVSRREPTKLKTSFSIPTEWQLVSKPNYGKKVIRTIYDYFSMYSREEVDFVLSNLNNKEKHLIELRYGKDLDNPITSSSFTKQKARVFEYVLLPKIAALLKLNRNEQLTEEEQKCLQGNINEKISREIKTIYQYLSEFSKEEVDNEILALTEEEKEVIRIRNGEDLENPKPSKEWNSKMFPKYKGIIEKLRRRLEKKRHLKEKKIPTIYALLKSSKEEVNELFSDLTEEEKELIFYANGEDLNNPVRIEEWNEELEVKYKILIRKLKFMLKERKTKGSKKIDIHKKDETPKKERIYVIKTIYQYLSEFSKEEVDFEIFILRPDEKEIIRLRNGEDLENPKPSEDWNYKMYPKYQAIIQKLRRRLEKKRKLKEKKILTIYVLLNSNKEEVDDVLLELTDEEKELMFRANGEDLNNPVRSEDWTDKMEEEYKLLLSKLKILLKIRKEKMANNASVVGSNSSASSFVQKLENPIYKELETEIVKNIENEKFFIALKKLSLKESMIMLLRFGYVDGICFPVPTIASFFGVSVEEIYEVMKKVLSIINELSESSVLKMKKNIPSL